MKGASWRTPLLGLAAAAALLLAGGYTPEASAQSTPAGTEADPFIVPFHWGLKPGSIEPGDKFRLMFQTENRRNGTSSTIGDYNSFVQGDAPPGGFHADISPYVSEFKAIVSTASVDARDNIGATGTGIQINWVNGSKVADDYTDFWDGSWRSRAPTLGSGVGAAGRNIFTGTDNDGTGYTDHQMGTGNPRYGSSRIGSPLSQGNTGNSGTRAFYAMSPVFQVDPAPPPVSVEFAKNTQVGRHQYDYNIEEGATLKPRLTFDPPTRAEATLIIHATSDTATRGVDFPAGPYRVTVPAGATRHTFDIEIPSDAAIEDYETFTLTIGKLPDGFRYDPQQSAMVQIVNVSVVPSNWRLIPAGLGAGDKFRLLFKTDTERDAHPSDIAEYDEFVRTRTAAHPWHADIEDYGDTFRVVGSTGAVDGNFHTGSGNIVASQQFPGHTTAYRPVYWLNGVKIADDYRFFWRGWWGDANAPANQRHADGLAATNTRGPTTGTSYCCITVSFGTEIHGSGIRTPDPYWLGGSRSTVVKGSGVASPDTGRHVSGRNSIQDEVVRDRPRGEVAPYLALSAVFEVGDFLPTDRVVWIDDGGTPGGPGDSYVGCTDPDYVPGGDPDCEPVLTHQTIPGTRVRIYEGEDATFTVHVDSAPTADLTVQVNVRDTRDYVTADDPDDDVVGEGIQKVVIPSGETSVTFTVPTNYENREDEIHGELIASILPGPGYRAADGSDKSRPNVGIVEIQGFWGLGGLSMSEVPGTHETNLNIPFTSAAGSAYTVHYRIVDAESTATYGTGNSADYNIRSGYNRSTNRGTFTVPQGSPSGKLPVWVNDDTRFEGTEEVVLEFTSPANLKPNKITIPIHDNEPPAKLKPYADEYAPEIDATLTEGYAPESEHQIRVAGFDYRGRRIGLEREVHYEYCVEGTATLGEDYELIKPDDTKVASDGCHPMTLPMDWERMKLVKVRVLDDGLYDEPDETVKIRLQRSTTAGMETDTSLATVPDSSRIPGETASVIVTIKDTLPALEVAYQVIVLEPDNNDTDQNPQRVRTDCQDAGDDRCRKQYRSNDPYIRFTVRTTSGLDLRDYVKAYWTVEDSGNVIQDQSEAGHKWLDRSTKSYFDIPVWLRHNAGDGYAVFKLAESNNHNYRVNGDKGKVCVAVNNGICPAELQSPPGQGAPPIQVPVTPVANLQVSAVDGDTATATWDAVPHATGYQVDWTARDDDGKGFAGRWSVTGTSTDIDHFTSEALTLTVTVTPEYVDGNGATVVLNGLAGTATLDLGPGGGGSLPEITVTGGSGIIEGDNALFTVSASPAPAADLAVTLKIADDGSSDFLAGGSEGDKTVTIRAGQNSASHTLATVDDSTDEAHGSVTATVLNGNGYTVGDPSTGTVAVSDNDEPLPVVSITGGAAVTEGGIATFSLSAAPAPQSALTVTVTVVDSGDFASSGQAGLRQVSIGTGGTGTLTVLTDDDSTDEPDGALTATIASGQGYTPHGTNGSASIAVNDDDAAPNACVSAQLQSTVEGYAQETGNGAAHVARWRRVLNTFAGNTAQGLSGAQARQMLAQYSASRWGPVVTAIECLEGVRSVPEITVTGGSGIIEGDNALFTVSASPAPAADLAVTLKIADDGSSDFLAGGSEGDKTVTIRAGQNSASHTLATVEDSTDEAHGSVTATVLNGNGYTVGDPSTGTVAVSDNDEPLPVVSITGGAAVTEGGTATFSLSAAPAPQSALTVTVTVVDSGDFASSGQDGARQVSIGTGGTGTLTVSTDDDSTDEPDGALTATIASGQGYTPHGTNGSASIAVNDDDAAPNACVSAQLQSTVEGYAQETGNGAAHVARWQRVLNTFAGNTALGLTGAEARQMQAQYSASRWVPVVAAIECLEGGRSVPEITVTGGSGITEGDNALFTVSASPAPAADLAVTLKIADDGSSDFLAGGSEGDKTVTIRAGQNSASHTLATVQDSTDEAHGSVTATVLNGNGYTVGDPSTGTVAVSDDDDPPPVVSITGGAAITEGDPASFSLSATPAPQSALTVTVNVVDSGDFASSGETGARQVTIGTGGTGTLTVSTAGDEQDEPDGSITATIASDQGYAPSSTNGSASIAVKDDDEAPPTVPTIRISGGPSVGEGRAAEFTVHADPAPEAALTVHLDVTEVGRGDFVARDDEGRKTVTIAAEASSATHAVATVNDEESEEDGPVRVTVVADPGYRVQRGAREYAQVRVRDDDSSLSLSVDDATVEEAPGAKLVFTVRLSEEPFGSVTVNYDPRDVTATDGRDYIGPKGTLVFRPFETEKLLTVTVFNDELDEGEETMEMVLSDAYGAVIADGVGVGTIRDSEDGAAPAQVRVEPASLSLQEGGSAGSYSVSLSQAPPSDVTVTAAVAAPSVARLSSAGERPGPSAVLTFTPQDWWRAQSVSVAPQEDSDSADGATKVSYAVQGTGAYARLSALAVDVAVADDDVSDASTGFRLAVAPERVREDAGRQALELSVALDGAPLDPETVPEGATFGIYAVDGDGPGAAEPGGDYRPLPITTIVIPAGARSARKAVAIELINNRAADSERQVVFEARPTGAASELGVSGATLTIVDDDSGRPGEATGLLAVPAGHGAVELSWQPPDEHGLERVSGYQVEASSDGVNWYMLRVNTGARKTVLTDTTLSAGESRSYRVTAINSHGAGEPSESTTGAATK